MKRLLGIGLLTVALCAPASATAGFKTGPYSGKSAQGPISFKLTKTSVTKLKFKLAFTCTDGDSFTSTVKGFPKLKIKQAKRGVVLSNADRSKRFLFRITSLKGSKAKGHIHAKWTYDEFDNPDGDGSVVCDTGVRKFSAKRR